MRALSDLGFEQRIVTGKNNPINAELAKAGIAFENILPCKESGYIRYSLGAQSPVTAADAVFTYTGPDQTLAVNAKKKGVKTIRIILDARVPKNNPFALQLHGKTDLIIVPSRLEEERFLKRVPLAGHTYLLEGHYERKGPLMENSGEERLQFIHIARSSKIKGHGDILKALSILKREGTGFDAVFIGNEAEIPFAVLAKEANALGIEENVRFSGFAADIEEYLALASIGLIGSLGSEVYSRVLYEYFAFGLPVAATAVGIIPEVFGNVRFGELANPGDPRSFAEALKKVIKGRAVYSKNVTEYYMKNLTFDAFRSRVSALTDFLK